jgi:hypothetical protein
MLVLLYYVIRRLGVKWEKRAEQYSTLYRELKFINFQILINNKQLGV